jgi:hypothetical protein
MIFAQKNSVETTCLFSGFHAYRIQQAVPRRNKTTFRKLILDTITHN